MSSDLPKVLRQMEVQCHTVLRAIATYRTETNARQRDQALHRIERACLQIAETIGVMPDEKRLYVDLINRYRDEVQRLTQGEN